jgi:chondroitin-sulfate-ABC endolyase/exolyase
MDMIKRYATLFLVPLATHAGVFNENAENITTGTHSLEETRSIENWQAVKSAVTISHKRAKVGVHSAKWSWKSGGYLILQNPEGLKEACQPYAGGSPEKYERKYVAPGLEGGVKLWLYNDSPIETGKLFIQVGHDADSSVDNPRYKIPVNLNFMGWRAVWIHFEQDARVPEYTGPQEMNCMALVPSIGTSGNLYIDWINFVSYMSLKRHSDHQALNKKPSENRYDSYTVLEYATGLEALSPVSFGKAEKEAFESITERYEFLVLGSAEERDQWMRHFSKSLSSHYKTARRKFDELGILKSNGAITGQPLFAVRDEHASPDGEVYQHLGASLLFPMALEYRLTGNRSVLEKLLTALDFMHDQGWAFGSALGSSDHRIRINGYANAVAIIRKELAESGRLERESSSLTWYSMLGAAFNTPENEGINTDLIRGGALPKLLAVLIMEDGEKKAGAMSGLIEYYNQVCDFAPGYSDTIKPDYSLYHHRSAYQSAYGVSMVTTMVMIDWLLDGTVYELSGKSKEILHNTLEAQLQMANKYDLHPGVSGRIQSRAALNRHLLPAYAFADDMSAQFNRLYAPELNRLGVPGLTYSGTLGTAQQMAKVAKLAGTNMLGPEDGHFTFPYAAYSTHRRDNWMAAVRGWSQYVWDFESGSKHENDLGRYVSHGALFIIPEEGFMGSAQDFDTGYHWGFLPGATTKALPVEETVFQYVVTPKYLECKHRNYTDETFVGGVKLGKNGFFSMKLHDTVAPDDERILFDDSFRATKSYFFVDDNIYCLGTGIENSDERYHTITTLFQNTIDVKLHIKDNGVYRDANGNAYVVPREQTVFVRKAEQDSYRSEKGRLLTCSGPNIRAWIDHGKAPVNGSYEYMIAVQPDTDTPEIPFRVLKKDRTAHIVQHNDLMACAIYDPETFTGKGVIETVDTPLLILCEESAQQLELAVADPDLRLEKWGHNMSFMPGEIVHAEAKPHHATIRLSGKWELLSTAPGVHVTHVGGDTMLKVGLQHGLTRELSLIK